MKLSNFKEIKRTKERGGKSSADFCVYATIDITTGKLFWKKTETVHIKRNMYSDIWINEETGKIFSISSEI